jgi:hypothetical protein
MDLDFLPIGARSANRRGVSVFVYTNAERMFDIWRGAQNMTRHAGQYGAGHGVGHGISLAREVQTWPRLFLFIYYRGKSIY